MRILQLEDRISKVLPDCPEQNRLQESKAQGLTALEFAQRGRDWDAGPNEDAIKADVGTAQLLSP